MHIAASLMTMMARPSCTTVRLFGASHCHVLPLRPACTVVVQSPRGWWGTVFLGVGNDKGGGVLPRCTTVGESTMQDGVHLFRHPEFVAPSLTLKRCPCVTSVNCNIVRIALTHTHACDNVTFL